MNPPRDYAEEKENGAEDKAPRWWAWMIASAVLGGGVGTGVQVVAPIRSDPFTGSEGRELARRIDTLERRQERLQEKVGQLPPAELTREVAGIKNEVDHIRKDHESYIRDCGKRGP